MPANEVVAASPRGADLISWHFNFAKRLFSEIENFCFRRFPSSFFPCSAPAAALIDAKPLAPSGKIQLVFASFLLF